MLSAAVRPTTHLLRFCQNTRRFQSAAATSSTINAAEIAHFSRLSSLWWNEQGEFSLLHRMNPVRVRYIREKLIEAMCEDQGEDARREMESKCTVLSGMDVLDVGCGGGLLSESLTRLGARTLGIDASESNIGIASTHASADPQLSSSGSALEYRHTSAEQLIKEPKRFDAVCSMEVIEHVDNPVAFLSACAQLVKVSHLFLSTIARTPLSYFLTILAAEHILRKVSVGTHTYSKFINPSELVSFFQTYGSSPSSSSNPTDSSHIGSSASPRPWITRTYAHGLPTRSEAEVRGMMYIPWSGEWKLMSRSSTPWGAAECNYLFWVRRPLDS
ncbi:S-adenosyl-L-methionine-dependent methyltransferase [Suillus clintonianus]|uniref:S-adenosyl-L-methionine-dependent methyltransferase n=1 Tax=Suillus clintonianus TaxID=1904413 RepID=UPI001B87E9CE|nr:S-adenosyl-L-methionine-dependent methyltransferase [Suillus clintonianus]KAG2128552.1 S-adenosyl-L-methionine-dependent methyltransferase [Suillus clintonianus]